jgi:hypothetical protein
VEELAVLSGADLIDRRRVQVDEDGARHVLSAARLGEEGLVRTTVGEVGRVGVGTSVLQQTMFQQVQLPGTVTKLHTSLANMKMADLRSVVSHIQYDSKAQLQISS